MLAATAIVGGVVAVFNMLPASAATCAAAWQSSAVYTGGATVSSTATTGPRQVVDPGRAPPGTTGVWAGPGRVRRAPARRRRGPGPPAAAATRPGWRGELHHRRHRAVHRRQVLHRRARQPGVRPDDQHLVLGAVHLPAAAGHHCAGDDHQPPSGFVVSEAQFNQMFPNRNSFYTYNGLVAALSAYPAFANTGSDTVKQAGGGGLPRQRQPRDRRAGLHRRAEHRQLPALLRHEPAVRLPGRAGRVLRPRPDPAELELQLQGGRRRARHRPARQPLPGADTTRPSPGRPASGTGTPRPAPAP